MLSFRQFLDENRLVHGTLADHKKSIRKHGLEPRTSEYSAEYYGEHEPTVFMTHETQLKKAVSSIRGQIGKKLNKRPHQVSHDDIEKHGMLVTTRIHDPHTTHKLKDDGTSDDMEGGNHWHDAPDHAEPGDYYSKDTHTATGFLTGKRLIRHLRNKGHLPE